MKKQKLKNLSLSKKTVSNLNESRVKGGTSTFSMDIVACSSGNVVSAILKCYAGYSEDFCNC